VAKEQDRHTAGNVHQIRFPQELSDRLRKASEDHSVAVNWLVNKAVREFLDSLLPPEEIKWTR